MQATRFKPQAVVKVFTETGELVARSKPKVEGNAIDAQVLSVSTNNDFAADAGVFTVQLVAKNRWDRSIAANDLIVIYLKRDSKDTEAKSAIFFGLVDDTGFKSTITNNQPAQTVTITGRNFAKAFIGFEIGVVSDAGEIGTSVGWLRGRINFVSQGSAQIIQQLIDVFVKKYMNYTFSNKKTFIELLKLKLSNRPNEQMLGETTFVNFQGSMYNFFKELIDEPFNQLYFEVLDGNPTLVLRETPFNEANWKQLPLHTITDDLVVDDDLSRNDIETYTLFSVGVSNHFGTFGSEGTLGIKPLVYEPYLKKYGIRRLHRYSNYIGIVQSGVGSTGGTGSIYQQTSTGASSNSALTPFAKQLLIPASKTNTRPGSKMTPTYITIHETDNTDTGASSKSHANLQYNGNSREASWHYTVDNKEIWQSIPDNEVAFHAKNSTGNTSSIAIEICVNKDGNFNSAVANAVKLTSYLREKYNIPIGNVVQHNHWSGKNCPRTLRSTGRWSSFLSQVSSGSAGATPAFTTLTAGETDPGGGSNTRPNSDIGYVIRTDGKSPTELARAYAVDLFNWNVMNPSFFSGQLTVRGENKYKVGDRALYSTYYEDIDEKGKRKKVPISYEFFIEAVSHDFVNFSHWITKLGVTRGLPNAGANRFKAPWGAYKEYTGGGVGDPTPEEVQAMVRQETQAVLGQVGTVGGGSSAGGGGSANAGTSAPSGSLSSGGSKAVAKYYLASPFRNTNNFGQNRGSHIHKGTDFSAPANTPLYALYDGTCIKNTYQAGGAGHYIAIQHANGHVTKYFHMIRKSPIPVGRKLKAGDEIGKVGSTGRSTGNHLHLEIWIGGSARNPVPILKKLAGG